MRIPKKSEKIGFSRNQDLEIDYLSRIKGTSERLSTVMAKMMTMLNNQRLLNLMTVGLLVLGTAPTFAQSTANPSARPDRKLSRVLFKPPSDDEKPEQTAEAGSRHGVQCLQDATSAALANSPSSQSSLIPLVPTTNFGLTIAERPILWIYLPEETSARQVVLSIREEGTTHHSKTFIPITGTSGIISLQPDSDSLPLKIGTNYKLSVVLVCGEKPSPNDPASDVWVRRVESPEPINQGSALAQAAWYGEQGIWYDALNSLIQARQSQPQNQDLIDIWADFLKSGGLNAIANEPVHF